MCIRDRYVCVVCVCVIDSELTEIDTLRGMMDVSLIFHTSLIAVCVDVTLALPHLLNTIYHTQVHRDATDINTHSIVSQLDMLTAGLLMIA